MVTVIVAGVGGQGALTLSRIIGMAALKAGLTVRIGETLGMSQRLGRVVSYVRFGRDIYSPLPPTCDVDFIIGLEPLEALRTVETMCEYKTTAIVNRRTIPTLTTALEIESYPSLDWIDERMRRVCSRVFWIDAYEAALSRIGDSRQENMVMLGAFAGVAGEIIPHSLLEESIKERFKGCMGNVALKAYKLGLELSSTL